MLTFFESESLKITSTASSLKIVFVSVNKFDKKSELNSGLILAFE